METKKRKGGSGEREDPERFFITKEQLRTVKEVLKSVEEYAQTPLMKNCIEEATKITKDIEEQILPKVEIGDNLKYIIEVVSEMGYGVQVTTDGNNRTFIALTAPNIDGRALNAVGAKSVTEFFRGLKKE